VTHDRELAALATGRVDLLDGRVVGLGAVGAAREDRS
jgi:hypothetical protein